MIYTNATLNSSDCVERDTKDLINTSGKIIKFSDQSEVHEIFKEFESYRDVLQEILEGNFSCDEIENKLMKFQELIPCKTLKKLIKHKHKFEEEVNKQYEEWTWDSWSEFMKNLKLCTEQPPLNKFQNLIKNILEDFCGTSKMFLELKENLTKWWSKYKTYYLTESVSPFWEEIIKNQASVLMSSMHAKMTAVCGLTFQHSDKISYSAKVIQIICGNYTEICCLRLQENLKDDHLLINISVLRQNLREVMFVRADYRTLIVDTSSDDCSQNSNDCIVKQIASALELYPEKRIIFISSSVHNIARQLSSVVYYNNFNLSQMSQESQQIVMNCLRGDCKPYPYNVNFRNIFLRN